MQLVFKNKDDSWRRYEHPSGIHVLTMSGLTEGEVWAAAFRADDSPVEVDQVFHETSSHDEACRRAYKLAGIDVGIPHLGATSGATSSPSPSL